MRTEEDVNKKIDEAVDKYMRENRRLQNGAISEVDDIRKDIRDVLEKYADEHGSISTNQIKSILREVESMEQELESVIADELERTVDVTTDKATTASAAALGALLAAGIISERKIKGNVKDFMYSRNTADNTGINDRLWRVSGDIIDQVRGDIRSGVIRGDSDTMISRNIKKTFEKNEWKIRRVIMTEGNNTFRKTFGEVAEQSGLVKAVRIIDNRGRHKYHKQHECYRLAEQDMYGWGKGVYRPQDTFIYDPHPQCTASFQYVLKDEVGKRDGDS